MRVLGVRGSGSQGGSAPHVINDDAANGANRANAERAQKLDEQKKERDRQRNTPKGQAAAWLKGLNKDITLLISQSGATAVQHKVPGSIRNEYKAYFESSKLELEGYRTTMERITAGAMEMTDFTEVKAAVEIAQKHAKELKKLLAVYAASTAVVQATS